MKCLNNIVLLFATVLIFFSIEAQARVSPCEFTARQQEVSPLGVRIAKIACEEHANWYKPFIGLQGRAGWQDGKLPMEAEGAADPLADGILPWEKVATYWRNTPVLDQMIDQRTAGAKDCKNDTRRREVSASCRAFILDNPWSAAFVSYVMKRARVRDFVYSAEHLAYLKDAHLADRSKPYRMVGVSAKKT